MKESAQLALSWLRSRSVEVSDRGLQRTTEGVCSNILKKRKLTFVSKET